ncbi:MAG: sodium:proton antiporter [Tenericutes bacterium GWD2_38_27]|nr:MAG: sodium:proton antiporter [Tenericutes bacterium GWD2_38_27]OHE45433.1 MAG: sodium:proton antiporter [Tenericutes bacterium GWF2_38_8]HBG32247.1 sodium:proton antiporter [Acholeplasmataceae bacterium]HCB67339.1 sodium:proton antiporter [Acholeplasmataceae bacterium]
MTLTDIIMIVVSVFLLLIAFFAVHEKKLIKSVIFLSALSMLSVVSYVLMKAPDVALTEAVIGSGLVTSLFIFTLLSIQKKEDVQ